MLVTEGDRVKKGQGLFADKRDTRIVITAPASGRVAAIHRGERRALLSVVIDVEDGGDDSVTFPTYPPEKLTTLDRETIESALLESGLWTAFRTRPFSRVPLPGTMPAAIFVTAMDSNPLAGNPQIAIVDELNIFLHGLTVLTRLTEGKVHVCHAEGKPVPVNQNPRIEYTAFDGPHPAGLVGTHIHFLEPVSAHKTVWHLGPQDVIAIGKLFVKGMLHTSRVVALAGPSVVSPRLVRTTVGANLDDLTQDELVRGAHRIISGSILSGRAAKGPEAFLGRYHTQISVLPEWTDREMIGWILPSLSKFSTTRTTLGHFLGDRIFGNKGFASWRKKLIFNTNINGGQRCIMPIGGYEMVMPLDILATMLLRDLLARDTDNAQDLGALELDEEDVALCTYVCPGKYEYGPMLRDVLTSIEKEG